VSGHPQEHRDFVDRVLDGELAESDAVVRARLEACGECREELGRLRALDAGLRATAGEARADVERARAQVQPADEVLVRRSLEAALPALAVRGPSSRRFLFALAAGLVLLLGGGALFYLRSGGRPAEILLSGGTIRCIAPMGEVDDYHEFSWSAPLPPGGSFVLILHVLEDDGAGALLRPPIRCQEPRWTPTPEERRALPDRIYWKVVAQDIGETKVEEGWARASRSR
jgi:AcrR family transcriptional regulator